MSLVTWIDFFIRERHWISEKAMAPHSSTLAWKIPWAEEPGRLPSMGSLRVRHDWATSLSLFTSCIGEGNGNPLQCSCLENPRDSGAWWAAVYGVAQSRTRLKRLSSSSKEHGSLILYHKLQAQKVAFPCFSPHQSNFSLALSYFSSFIWYLSFSETSQYGSILLYLFWAYFFLLFISIILKFELAREFFIIYFSFFRY